MKEIGELLRQKRLENGFTIEYVSAKTRLSIPHIKAIEEGNIEYFKNDLPYLRYFLRSYCVLLNLDFDSLKDKLQFSIDDYTATFMMKTIKEHEMIESNINQHKKEFKESNEKKNNEKKVNKPTLPRGNAKARKKIDYSLVSFLTIVVIVVAVVVCIAGFYLIRNMNEKPVDNDPIVEVNPPVVEPLPIEKPTDEPKEEIKAQLEIIKKDASTYVIQGYGDLTEIKVTAEFVPRAWFLATKDGNALENPASRVYETGEVAEIILNPSVDKQLDLRIGYFAGMKFKVNDVDVVLDDSIANDPSSRTIVFEIGGKESESAQ